MLKPQPWLHGKFLCVEASLLWKILQVCEAAHFCPLLCVEDDLWYLSIFHRGAVVVAGSVVELEGDLAARDRLMCHLPQTLGAVVGVGTLETRQQAFMVIKLTLYLSY